MAELYYLEKFGLTPATLKKLGSRKVVLHAYLRGPEVKTLFRYAPAERLERMRECYERQARQAVRAWPSDTCTVKRSKGVKSRPYAIAGELPAAKVHLLLGIVSLESVWIEAVAGRKPRPQTPKPEWFTVHARFAIEIEGQTKGMQTYEERFIMVKAKSFDDAERLVRPGFRAYASPYINPDGEMVRWVFEEIIGVSKVDGEQFDGSPVEVFSTLKTRPMRPDRVWQPRKR